MLFSEPLFLFCFLPLVLLFYFGSPRWLQNTMLCAASVLFYAVGGKSFTVILLASVALNYFLAVWIEQARGKPGAALLLAVGIMSDLGLLLVFKYANFLVDNLDLLFRATGAAPIYLRAIGLPLGISFFTFHKISYKVDVYRAEADARKNPIDLALYILFFPQLIAGPIVRYHEIASQLTGREVTREGFALGVRRFVIGLGKKMILANTVAVAADGIFNSPLRALTPAVAWLGIACYALQIYFDFAGYSDMAIGLAHLFGFRFPENFNYPYAANSITDFWRRWHMSLSRWFRDYLYIPLGGNRRGARRTYFNLVFVFFLCGLWHGAAWSFVVWGLFHGAFLVLERLGLLKVLDRLPRPVRHAYVLLVVLVGWVFFRARDFHYAAGYLAAMAGFAHGNGLECNVGLYLNNALALALVVGMIGSAPTLPAVGEWLRSRARGAAGGVQGWYDGMVLVLEPLGLAAVFLLSAMLMSADTYNPFIYFRF